LFKVIVAGIARNAAVKSGPADDVAWLDVRVVAKPIEICRSLKSSPSQR
jgi:hypothetical protein